MKKALLKLHIAVLIAGTTGLFGKLITLGEFPLTWFRVVLAALLFWLFMALKKKLHPVPARIVLKMGGVGLLLALHWVFFYGSIKYSNISIGVVCFSLVGFFTAIFEPLICRHRPSVRELLFSLLTVLGVLLIFHFDTRYRFGSILGVVSSALNSLFTIANKLTGRSSGYTSSTLLLYALTGGALGMTLLLPFWMVADPVARFMPSVTDLAWLLVLASLCTIVLYVLQIQVLQVVSAFTVNLTFNLEPIYSIAMAMLLFGEAQQLNLTFYVGLMLIFLSVGLQTLSVARHTVST